VKKREQKNYQTRSGILFFFFFFRDNLLLNMGSHSCRCDLGRFSRSFLYLQSDLEEICVFHEVNDTMVAIGGGYVEKNRC